MILSGDEILKRLKNGEIFKAGSWDESALKEASYALRIAPDGLMVEEESYPPGKKFPREYIEIEPGRIAVLSTVERLNMPDNLVGKIGVRLDQALQGVTGLMGIQVDPLYGSGEDDERLFIRVANLGNEPVRLFPGDQVFTFELHELKGKIGSPPHRDPMWHRITRRLSNQNKSSWTYITRVRSDLTAETEKVRHTFQPIVLFGVFLVAVTILGVAISLILSVRDTPQLEVPSWVTNWGWILLYTLSVATLSTALVGVATFLQSTAPLFSRKRRRDRKRRGDGD